MIKPKKKLGQNFLTDPNVSVMMVDALNIGHKEKVIEIGPGLGAVTSKLLSKINEGSVIAIELDKELVAELKEKFKSEIDNKKLQVINKNILDFLPQFSSEEKFKIIGSLPYYITSPILHKICYMQKRPASASLLIQKEVAEKISAKCPNGSYMSTFIQTFFEISIVSFVEKHSFNPVPKVESAIIKLEAIENAEITMENLKKYENFLHRGFSNPRKMLNKIFSQKELEKTGIDGRLRAQNIEIKKWIQAFKIIRSS